MTGRVASRSRPSPPPASAAPAEKGLIERGVEKIIEIVTELFRQIKILFEKYFNKRPEPVPIPAPVVDPKVAHRENLRLIQMPLNSHADAPGVLQIYQLFNQYIKDPEDRAFIFRHLAGNVQVWFWQDIADFGKEKVRKNPAILAPYIEDAIKKVLANN